MILGIDASNIRFGGGVTHLVELLRAADPPASGFSRVIVWGGRGTLGRLEDRDWLIKASEPLLNKNLAGRIFWQRFQLSRMARDNECDLLFVPGGSYAGDFRPVVTMSRNMLPFEWREMRRYGWSLLTLRNLMLRYTQARTFRRADGLIFLTDYARSVVLPLTGGTSAKVATIPHGVDESFVCPTREQLPITSFTPENPFRILYVSIIEVYKHQWHVARAVARLREEGWPVILELAGPAYPPALRRLNETLRREDPVGEIVHYLGAVPYPELPELYRRADLVLFASSCENMPNILLEGMASGLPIACSNRGPMPEILGSGGVYFDPEDPEQIAEAIRKLIASPDLRAEKAGDGFARAKEYSWTRCARETFAFLARVAARRRTET
jgi:glycosyltransferase involved in cell wall biosynthesis